MGGQGAWLICLDYKTSGKDKIRADKIYFDRLTIILHLCSLREHLFYVGVLLLMTIIVVSCFLLVKNRKSSSQLSLEEISAVELIVLSRGLLSVCICIKF